MNQHLFLQNNTNVDIAQTKFSPSWQMLVPPVQWLQLLQAKLKEKREGMYW